MWESGSVSAVGVQLERCRRCKASNPPERGGGETADVPAGARVRMLFVISIVLSIPACHAGDPGFDSPTGRHEVLFGHITRPVGHCPFRPRSTRRPRPRSSPARCAPAKTPGALKPFLSLAAGPAPWSCEHASPLPLRCPPIPTATMLGSERTACTSLGLSGVPGRSGRWPARSGSRCLWPSYPGLVLRM